MTQQINGASFDAARANYLLCNKSVSFGLPLLLLMLTVAIPLLARSASAQIQGPDGQMNANGITQPEALEALGGIAGTITDEDGNPLAGITVSAYEDQRYSFARLHGQALTDDSGRYTVTGLRVGTYLIRASDSEGLSLTSVYGGDDDWLRNATPVRVAGDVVDDINIAMRQGGQITGRIVVDEAFDASDVSVAVYPDGFSYGSREVVSPVDGIFRTPALPAGAYRICAEINDDGVSIQECYGTLIGNRRSAPTVSLAAGETLSGIDIGFGGADAYGTLSGYVKDVDGNPIENATVSIRSDFNSYGSITDETGHYSKSYIQPDQYTLRTEPSGYLEHRYVDELGRSSVNVAAGAHLADINFALEPIFIPQGKIRGKVNVIGFHSPAEINVAVYRAGASAESRLAWGTVHPVTGEYEVTGLAPDSYIVEAVVNQYSFNEIVTYYGGTEEADAIPVEVVDGQITDNVDIDFDFEAVPHDGALAGQVTHQGEPLAGIRVNLYYSDPAYPEPVFYTETDTNGTYLIQGLHKMVRRVGFQDLSGLYATLFSSGDYSFYSAQGVELPGDGTLEMNADLPLAGGFSGVALNRDGSAANHLQLLVRRLESDGQQPLIGILDLDPDGGYAANSLAPGDYLLSFVLPPEEGPLPDDVRLQQQIAVTVVGGKTTVADPAIVGAGIPLSLEIIAEPSTSGAVYLPIYTQ